MYGILNELEQNDDLDFEENRGYIMVRAISVYSAGVPYAARFTAAVKIPLPLATFQF